TAEKGHKFSRIKMVAVVNVGFVVGCIHGARCKISFTQQFLSADGIGKGSVLTVCDPPGSNVPLQKTNRKRKWMIKIFRLIVRAPVNKFNALLEGRNAFAEKFCFGNPHITKGISQGWPAAFANADDGHIG